MSNLEDGKSYFLPDGIPYFTNFDRYAIKNASTPSLSATDAAVIDTKYLTTLRKNYPYYNTGVTYTADVDANNAFTLQKIACVSPANTLPNPSSIFAYKLNINKVDPEIVDCVNKPSQEYTSSYMPKCLPVCAQIPNTPSPTYSCNVNTPSTSIYIPVGGWQNASVQNDLYNSPSVDNKFNLSIPITKPEINVTDDSGNPLYIANTNSTSNINTWTKLQDLCVPNN